MIPYIEEPHPVHGRGVSFQEWRRLKQKFVDGSIARDRLLKESTALHETLADTRSSIWNELFHLPPREYGRSVRQLLGIQQVDSEEELLEKNDSALGKQFQPSGQDSVAAALVKEQPLEARLLHAWPPRFLQNAMPPFSSSGGVDTGGSFAFSHAAVRTLGVLTGMVHAGAAAVRTVPGPLLRCAVVGGPLSGKTAVAAALSKERSLQLLSPSLLLQQAAAAYAAATEGTGGELPPPKAEADVAALNPRGVLEHEVRHLVCHLPSIMPLMGACGWRLLSFKKRCWRSACCVMSL